MRSRRNFFFLLLCVIFNQNMASNKHFLNKRHKIWRSYVYCLNIYFYCSCVQAGINKKLDTLSTLKNVYSATSGENWNLSTQKSISRDSSKQRAETRVCNCACVAVTPFGKQECLVVVVQSVVVGRDLVVLPIRRWKFCLVCGIYLYFNKLKSIFVIESLQYTRSHYTLVPVWFKIVLVCVVLFVIAHVYVFAATVDFHDCIVSFAVLINKLKIEIIRFVKQCPKCSCPEPP